LPSGSISIGVVILLASMNFLVSSTLADRPELIDSADDALLDHALGELAQGTLLAVRVLAERAALVEPLEHDHLALVVGQA
jgi:hypothetical protein